MLPLASGLASSWLLSVVAFAVAMSASPGPNNAMVAASGATFGIWRTLPHILGVSLGFPVMLVAVALGAGEVLRAHPSIHEIMKWLGAAYLLWLAWHIAVARPTLRDEGAGTGGGAGPARGRGRPLGFLRAALFQWINPKAWVIALGAVATYTSAEGSPGSGLGTGVTVQSVWIAVIFLVVCLPTTTFWASVGAGAARLLRSERGLRCFNLAMAALLVLSLLPLLREG